MPELIRFLQDRSLDQTTRKWALQALREITQEAWLSWCSSQPKSW
ncbi:MAG: hypothetical protein ACLQGV_06280 [Bryobacteraceae bacterium]